MSVVEESLPFSEAKMMSCIIRLSPNGVYLHANVGHTQAGVQSVDVHDSGDLVVYHASPGSVMVAHAIPDETLGGSFGITTGISGGNGSSRIRLYDTRIARTLDLNVPGDYARVADTGSNLWCLWIHYVPTPLPPHPESTAWRGYPRAEPVCYEEA